MTTKCEMKKMLSVLLFCAVTSGPVFAQEKSTPPPPPFYRQGVVGKVLSPAAEPIPAPCGLVTTRCLKSQIIYPPKPPLTAAVKEYVTLQGIDRLDAYMTSTDERGRFSFYNIPPGIYKIKASGCGGGSVRGVSKVISVAGDKILNVLLREKNLNF